MKAVLALLALVACTSRPDTTHASQAAARPGPADSLIPSGPLGDAVRRGRALLLATRDSLPTHVGNRLRCVSCHLDEGRRSPGTWIGAYARYPTYRSRSGSVETIEYRVNDCFQRSMNGSAIDPAGRDMAAIVAYLAFLSRDVVISPPAKAGANPQRWSGLTADSASGRKVYGSICAKCHGNSGEGTVAAPPLWGDKSFNIGAGMARVRTAAEFIRANMPYDRPGTLTDQQAFDVAAYVVGRPRPDYRGKEHDWPNGDPPPDVAYPTLAARRAPRR